MFVGPFDWQSAMAPSSRQYFRFILKHSLSYSYNIKLKNNKKKDT